MQLISGTGVQLSASLDVWAVTPVTFNPTVTLTATCAVAVSPDSVTYTTLVTKSLPALAGLLGFVDEASASVPAGWYLRLTVNAQAVLGLTSHY